MRSGAWSCGAALALGAPHAAVAAEVLDIDPPGAFHQLTLDVGGFVQPRLDEVRPDVAAGTAGELGFSVHQARLELSGGAEGDRWAPVVGWRLGAELASAPTLTDAWVEVGMGAIPLRLRAGQLKVAAVRAVLTEDSQRMFPDQPLLVTWAPQRDLGASLTASLGRRHVEATAGAFDGEGIDGAQPANRTLLYAGHLAVSPLGAAAGAAEVLRTDDPRPTVTLGGSVYRHELGEPGLREGRLGAGGELFAHWRWFTAQGEWRWGMVDFEDPAMVDVVQRGWYAQLAAFAVGVPWLQDHFALAGRVEQGDSADGPRVTASGPLDDTQATRRITVGAGLYAGRPLFDDIQDLRLVFAWTLDEELEGYTFHDNRVTVAASFAF